MLIMATNGDGGKKTIEKCHKKNKMKLIKKKFPKENKNFLENFRRTFIL